MAIITREVSKTKFETGDIPTQSEYADFHDSIYWKLEGLGNLVTVTGSHEIQIPANQMLTRIVVYVQNGNADISLGDTSGSKEHLEDEPLIIDVPRVFDIDPIFSINGQSVFLTFGNSGVSLGTMVYYIQ